MGTPFYDDDRRSYQERDQAQGQRAKLGLIRNAIAAGDAEGEAGDEDRKILDLARGIAEGTDGVSFIIAELDNRPEMRAFVDAVIGATGGSDGFVEITDEVLAGRLGRSTKTVQEHRIKFRELDKHGLLIEIKEHWRHPETHASHPHAYNCKVTLLAAEAVENAKLSTLWSGDAEDRARAMKEAAEIVTRGLLLGKPRKAKKRKMKTDAQIVALNFEQACKKIQDATKRRPMVKNPDLDQLWEARQKLLASLEEFDRAYGFEGAISMQDQEKKDGNAPGETVVDGAVETQVEVAQVEKTSTCNDSTESTVYGNREISGEPVTAAEIPPDESDPPLEDETAMYAREVRESLARKMAEGKTEAEAFLEVEGEIGEFDEWAARHT